MRQRVALRLSLLILSVLAHFVAWLQFLSEGPRGYVPAAWSWEVLILVLISFATSLGAIGARSSRVRNPLLVLELVVLILIGIPEGTSLAIETTLSALLTLECILLNPLPWRVLLPITTIVVTTTIQSANITFAAPVPHPAPSALMAFTAILTLVAALSLLISRLLDRLEGRDLLIDRLNSTIAQLTDANVGFQRYASEVESESVTNERKRVSREIHDTIGYTITTLIMLMEAASDLVEGDRMQLKALLKQGIDQAISSLDEIRRSLRELRAMEVPRIHGLRAIKKMIQAFQGATRVQVTVDFSNVSWDFDEETNEVFYRMIQESLANAFRHGGATRVAVNFSQNEREVRVSIRDDGKGSAEIHEGIGLSGMRERIGRMNGQISAASVADGFLLTATVPLGEMGVNGGT